MDYTFEVYGMAFVADEEKTRANLANHGVSFERTAEGIVRSIRAHRGRHRSDLLQL